ncbi:MAG TPA: AI-2E family transporter [Geobacteraceae bacterium]
MAQDTARNRIFLALAATCAGLVAAGYYIPHTFSALLTAVVIAYLVNPGLKYLERQGFDRFTALILLYGIGAFCIFLATFLLVPYLGHQVEGLSKALPGYLKSLQALLERWKSEMAGSYQSEEGAWLVSEAELAIDHLGSRLSGKGYEQLKMVLFGLFNLVLAPILIFFMLLYKQHVKDFIKRLFHHSSRHYLIDLGRSINRTLERFILAMLLDCLLVGLLTAAALALLGIEFPLLNGLFAGFASIVPFVGAMVAVIPPALIGYAQSGDLWIIPKVAVAYFVINVIIEGNLIKPLVMRRTLRLNPLAVIFAVMAMGELLGFWGIVLAIPAAAVLKLCTAELREMVTQTQAEGDGH